MSGFRLFDRTADVGIIAYGGVDHNIAKIEWHVASVVEICHRAGISAKVARMRPLVVVKG